MDGKCIVIVGNLSDGFKAVGPFESFDDGAEWADKLVLTAQTWVMTVVSKEEADENGIGGVKTQECASS